jgi:hypothetical protein
MPEDNPGGNGGAGDRTYSAAEMKAILEDHTKRVSAKFADYDELKAAAGQIEGLTGQLETTAKERDEARQRADEAEAVASKTLLSSAVQAEVVRAGARKPDHVMRLIDREAIRLEDGKVVGAREAVKAFADDNPDYFGAGLPPARDGGARPASGPSRTPDMNDIIRGAASPSAR